MHAEYLASIKDDLDDLKRTDPDEYARIETTLQATAADAKYARFLAERRTHRLRR